VISPYNLVVNPSGTRVYVTNNGSNKVSVIDTGTNSVVASITVENNPDGIAINPAGTRVYVANTESDSVSVIDTGTNQVMNTMKVGYKPYAVAVNPSGTRAYVTSQRASGKPTFNVIDISNDANQVVDTMEAGWSPEPYGIVVNPAGTLIYVGDQIDSKISVIDANTNKLVTTIQVGHNPFNVAINPSGTRVYVTHIYDGGISVIDTSTNKAITGILPENNNGFAFGIAIGTVPCNTVTEIPVAECQELLSLYHSTNGANWRNKTGWNQNNIPCSWAGITCEGGHVTEINLSVDNLSGSLPDLNLPNLQVLQLSQNGLSGNIPDFSKLPNLQSLDH
jgi:YVTN family beta-propeller protein